MSDMAGTAVRECPECGLVLPMAARDCPCCGCAPGGTGLVDHLPPADNDNRFAPVAVVAAGLVAGEVVLAALAPVAAIAVGAGAVALVAVRAAARHR
jgi:hypothetical protein